MDYIAGMALLQRCEMHTIARAFWSGSILPQDGVEVISGTEEAPLIHLGLVSNLRINSWPGLMVDLGGGSCELTISAQKHIRETFFPKLG